MKKERTPLSALLLSTAVLAATLGACGSKPQLGQASVEEVIGAMTLEEKVSLVVGAAADPDVAGKTRGLVPGAAGATCPIRRLGIPAIVLADGPAGLRINPTREGDTATYYCTQFPIATSLASTWDVDLVEQVGRAIGNEALEHGVDVLLAPALNIQRHPLCGRDFEYYSEDPLVSGKMAAAYVRGVQANGVGACIKHFAVNNQETNRMGLDARVSRRALREIYLKGFEIAVKEGKPWAVMSSYNGVNGVSASENPELLTALLRDEWGFAGVVMSDWHGGKDAVAQMKAGNDMLQPGQERQRADILAGVESGKLDEAVLDANVGHILGQIVRTPRFKGYACGNKPGLEAHAALARRAAAEGMVLLKNDSSALPLAPETRIVALYGCASYDYLPGGTGSGNVHPPHIVSLPEGLRHAGYAVDTALEARYEACLAAWKARREPASADEDIDFRPVVLPKEPEMDAGELMVQAARADVAIITIGRSSGESSDREVSDFGLDEKERRLVIGVCEAFHAVGKRVVVVLDVGGVVETASWKAWPDAILCAWQGGQEGGHAVADVLGGKVSPCGRLPMTFPVRLQDHASTENFPVNLVAEPATDYEEDIFVGYRYFDGFSREVSYPFGHGLGYTTFEYARPVIEVVGDSCVVRVDVTNVGRMPGKEVVQLYVAAPDAARANKPDRELKAFAKTPELQPGETVGVTLTVQTRDLASFNEADSSWRVDGGEYLFLVGASSRDIRTVLKAVVEPSVEKVGDLLRPRMEMTLLRR